MRGTPAPIGHRMVDPRGYTLIKLGRTDPRAMGNGWQYEHRLVMMEHLGRPLEPGEQVRHMNGDLGDNHVANLHLIANGSTRHCQTCTC